MSVAITPSPRAPSIPPGVLSLPIWRLSVSQYHSMIEAGILTEDDPVELLDGWLVTKMPKNPPHRLSTQLTREALAGILPVGWHVDAQEPMTLADSEPEPDVMVVRGQPRDYAEHHPGPEDLALVVEVADATLQRDRTLKKRLYAQAGISVYWLIDLVNRQMEVYSEPFNNEEQADYQHLRICRINDSIPIIIEGQTIGQLVLRDLLP